MKLYFILIEAARMISTPVIMLIITIAICVFSALLLFLFFSTASLDEFLTQGLNAIYLPQDAKC